MDGDKRGGNKVEWEIGIEGRVDGDKGMRRKGRGEG